MFPLARVRIGEGSMRPALGPGDYVLVNRWAYRHRAPAVGDLVVLRNPEREGQFLCKRIVGVTDAGAYVVVGDNAAASRDRRHFGPVPRGLIGGKGGRAARGARGRRVGVRDVVLPPRGPVRVPDPVRVRGAGGRGDPDVGDAALLLRPHARGRLHRGVRGHVLLLLPGVPPP